MREIEFLPPWYAQFLRRRRTVFFQTWVTVGVALGLALWIFLADRNQRTAELVSDSLSAQLQQTNNSTLQKIVAVKENDGSGHEQGLLLTEALPEVVHHLADVLLEHRAGKRERAGGEDVSAPRRLVIRHLCGVTRPEEVRDLGQDPHVLRRRWTRPVDLDAGARKRASVAETGAVEQPRERLGVAHDPGPAVHALVV